MVANDEWRTFLMQGNDGGVLAADVFAEIAKQVTVEGAGQNAFIPSRTELTSVMARVFGTRAGHRGGAGNIADQVKELINVWIAPTNPLKRVFVPGPSDAQLVWLRWLLLSQRSGVFMTLERKIRGRSNLSMTVEEHDVLEYLVHKLMTEHVPVNVYGEELAQRNAEVAAQEQGLLHKMAAYKHLQRQMPIGFAVPVDEDVVIKRLVDQDAKVAAQRGAAGQVGGDPTARREIARARKRQQERRDEKEVIADRRKLVKLGKAIEDDPYLKSFERVGLDTQTVVNRLFNADLHQRMYGEERKAFEQGRRQDAFSMQPVEDARLFDKVPSEAGRNIGKPSSFGKNAIYLF